MELTVDEFMEVLNDAVKINIDFLKEEIEKLKELVNEKRN